MRAHAILLSDRKYSINQIADIYQVDRDRVSAWLQWWEEYEFEGLDDDPRSGRPSILTTEERQQVIELVKEEPRTMKRALPQIARSVGKLISGDTLKSLLRDAEYVWKRLRRSVRGKRDEAEFRLAQAELIELRTVDLAGTSEYELWYWTRPVSL